MTENQISPMCECSYVLHIVGYLRNLIEKLKASKKLDKLLRFLL